MKIVMISNLGDDRSPWDVPSNECRAWAYVLGADTRNAQRVESDPQLVADYDLAIVELTSNLLHLPAALKERFPHLIVVGLPEGWVGSVSSADEATQCAFVAAYRSVDMLGVLVERAVSYYQLLTAHPRKAQWIGVPFPKEWTDQFPLLPVEAKQKTILLPFGLRGARSGLAHVMAFRALRERYPHVRGIVPRGLPRDEEYLGQLGVDVEIISHMDWPTFFPWLRHAYAVLDLDHLATWGRLAADCAAAHVPYVGSNVTHCGRTLGVLTCDPFDVSQALGYLGRIIDSGSSAHGEYRSVTLEQYARLRPLAEAPSRERFWAALDTAVT